MENTKNDKKPKAPPPVKQERIEKAVDALMKWVKSQPKYQKPQLLEHDEFLYMIVTLKKIPAKERTNPYKIRMPNPLFSLDGSQEICLIINDGEKRTSRVSSEFAKAKIKEESLPISKVLKYSKLKTDYKPFEAKRKLCGSYDMFMADRSVIPLLPRHLGKTFFKKKKHPIPVDLSHKQWRRQIELACSCALVYLRGGTCCVVKVGKVSQERDEIVQNVSAVIDGLAEVIPKKWKNVRSLHLKMLESVALPIYQVVPERPFKIEGVGSGAGLQVSVEESEKEVHARDSEEGEKKAFKKGRIHNVRYMDHMLGDMSDDLLGNKDQNEGLLGDDNQYDSFLGYEEQNDGLLDDEDQKEVDLPLSSEVGESKVFSGDDECDGRIPKSTEKNGSGKKIAGARRRKDSIMEGNSGSLNDGDVIDSMQPSFSTPASGHRKKSKSIDSGKASAKKGKTKNVEDGTVMNSVKGSAKIVKNKHFEDGTVTDVKSSAKKLKIKIFEDEAVTDSVNASGKKGKTKLLRGKAIAA
ncbi:hypothetical protein SUGI_1029160 [Cryptomeria japonica]|uniref:uncharacterized protein LOC131036704 n=1 Tax=Cryptomeria japonica TaxID=3369 RepID=UPI002414CBF6|nr:uncharacterized protein LOC131036704 [Cryptomeria japonica]GLJ48803.1 hypothetical protein SUGI_1029160 [Cryptomeria japonica]